MPRDTFSINALTIDSSAYISGSAITPANGAQVNSTTASKLLFELQAAAGTAGTATFKAGAAYASRSAMGDLNVLLAAGSKKMVCVEAARFAQADGKIYIDANTGAAITLTVYQLPPEM